MALKLAYCTAKWAGAKCRAAMLALSVCTLAGPQVASAGTLTLTGADLLSMPTDVVAFPTVPPVVSGQSTLFGAGQPFDKLLSVQVLKPGAIDGSGQYTIDIALDLTRLACDLSSACSDQQLDSDLHLLLSDGSMMLGAYLTDNRYIDLLTLQDAGDRGANRQIRGRMLDGYTLEDIGKDHSWRMTFDFGPGSGVSVSTAYEGWTSGSTFLGSSPLDLSKGLSVVLMRDNDDGERYQLNMVNLTADNLRPIPVPGTLPLMAAALCASLIGTGSRRTGRPALQALAR